MIQIIIYSMLIIAIFVYTFARLIKKNDSNYIYLLIVEFFGIIADFIIIITRNKPNFFAIFFLYLISIIIPIIYFIMESKDIYIDEILNILKAYSLI